MKLIADIKDSTLLFKLMHQLGTSFYKVSGDGLFEVVYHSGEKAVHFRGKLDANQVKILEASAWKVEEIFVDEDKGEVKIKQ